MFCQICGYKTEIIDTRPSVSVKGLDTVRRRHRCLDCGHKFTTIEIDSDLLKKLKRDSKLLGKINANAKKHNGKPNKENS